MTSLDDQLDIPGVRAKAVGRERVRIICGKCGGSTVGKVWQEIDGWRIWLNYYGQAAPGYPTARSRPRVARTSLVNSGVERVVWCERHGDIVVSCTDLLAAVKQADTRSKIVRLVVCT